MTTTERVDTAEAVVKDLKGRIRGPLIRPGDPGYDEARSVWNAMIDRRPALIARCLGTADVVAGVNAAREHGLPLSIKGGGHNIAGLAVCEGGLMLDMSLMRGVWVDPRGAHRARAGRLPARRRRSRDPAPRPGGGARLRLRDRLRRADARRRIRLSHPALRLDDATTSLDRSRDRRRAAWSAPPSTRTPTCSGGCAAAAATSALPRASNTGSTRSGREIVGGAIAWRGEEAAGVLELYRAVVANAPPRADLRRRAAPGAAGALDRQGRPRQADRRALRLLLGTARGRRAGAGADQGVRQPGRRHRAAAAVRVAADAARRDPAEGPALLLEVRVPARASSRSCFTAGDRARRADRLAALRDPDLPARRRDQRAARGSLRGRQPGRRRASSTSRPRGSTPTTTPRNIEWARERWRDMRRFSTGGTYVNFLTEEEGDDRTRAGIPVQLSAARSPEGGVGSRQPVSYEQEHQ